MAQRFKSYEHFELNFKSRYKRKLLINVLIILVLFGLIWNNSSILNPETYSYQTPYVKMFYELVRKYLTNFGEPGIATFAITLIAYQILKLRKHLKMDCKVEKLLRR